MRIITTDLLYTVHCTVMPNGYSEYCTTSRKSFPLFSDDFRKHSHGRFVNRYGNVRSDCRKPQPYMVSYTFRSQSGTAAGRIEIGLSSSHVHVQPGYVGERKSGRGKPGSDPARNAYFPARWGKSLDLCWDELVLNGECHAGVQVIGIATQVRVMSWILLK